MMFCDRGHENYFATGGVERTDYFIGMDAQDGQGLSAEDERGRTQITNVGKWIMAKKGHNIKTGATSAACAAW